MVVRFEIGRRRIQDLIDSFHRRGQLEAGRLEFFLFQLQRVRHGRGREAENIPGPGEGSVDIRTDILHANALQETDPAHHQHRLVMQTLDCRLSA